MCNWCSLSAEPLELLLRKVDSLAATQREILILLRKRQGHQRAEAILELNVAQSKEELEAPDHRLKGSDFRKRVVSILVISGAHEITLKKNYIIYLFKYDLTVTKTHSWLCHYCFFSTYLQAMESCINIISIIFIGHIYIYFFNYEFLLIPNKYNL